MVKVVFLHPDLGIGGAERAVVDAALALQSRGHSVHLITAHHDPSHCFEETRDGRLPVTAVGDWLPRSVLGRCRAFFAYLRMIYAAFYLVWFSGLEYNLVFCDQISACIPVLLAFGHRGSKVLFYCHFPDLLLTQRDGVMKKLYRAPIDWLEEKTTGMAHCVLVNSHFTAGIFKVTFQSLRHTSPEVLYPIPDFTTFDQPVDEPTSDFIPPDAHTVFLSINRYERKKNLGLAITALAKLGESRGNLIGLHLVVAGGYDDRVAENVEHHLELVALTQSLALTQHVTFLRSITSAQKRALLSRCTCLLYTPDREHFGIVPVESMYARCPVIAVDSGGPRETVVDGVTGYLRAPEPQSFAEAMAAFVKNPDLKCRLGDAGNKRVRENFSFEAFTEKLDAIVCGLFEQ